MRKISFLTVFSSTDLQEFRLSDIRSDLVQFCVVVFGTLEGEESLTEKRLFKKESHSVKNVFCSNAFGVTTPQRGARSVQPLPVSPSDDLPQSTMNMQLGGTTTMPTAWELGRVGILQPVVLVSVFVLAALCLLQAFLLRRARKQAVSHGLLHLPQLQTKLETLRVQKALTDVESQTLYALIRQKEPHLGMQTLLETFVPNTSAGFAAVVQEDGVSAKVVCAHGLSRASVEKLHIDVSLREQFLRKNSPVLRADQLFDTDFWAGLSKQDRRKVHRLFLFEEEIGTSRFSLLTTELPVPEASLKQRLEVAHRLFRAALSWLNELQFVQASRSELKKTKERLELQTLVDENFRTPTRMLELTMSKLAESIEADRAAVLLVTQDRQAKTLVRCGKKLPAGVDRQQKRWEELIAAKKAGSKETRSLGQTDLQQLGVEALIRAALVTPAYQTDRLFGVLVLTRHAPRDFERNEVELAHWTGKLVSGTLQRVVELATIQREANLDGLTELANRRVFDLRLEKEVQDAQIHGRSCALVLFDLDHFKAVNDQYGHQAGDAVLRAVSSVMRDVVSHVRTGEKAITARYGGEELAVLLPGFRLDGAMRIAESVRTAVERTIVHYNNEPIHVTISVGVAVFPQHARSAKELLSAADHALYEAKRSGRNRVCVAELPSVQQDSLQSSLDPASPELPSPEETAVPDVSSHKA